MDKRRKIAGLFDRVLNASGASSGVLLTFIMLLVSLSVIMRYFFHRPMELVTELSAYSLIYITFLAAAWVLKRDGHVKVELIVSRLNPRYQALLDIAHSFLCAIICMVLIWYGLKMTVYYYIIGYTLYTVLEPPKWILTAIIPFGSLLLFIQFLRQARGYLAGWKEVKMPSAREDSIDLMMG